MDVTLNHTIVWCRDKSVSAGYLTEILGLPAAKGWGPFMIVEMGNGVSLDYHVFGEPDGEICSQHSAFLVSEQGFDEALGWIEARGQQYWADPGLTAGGRINRRDGGRGVYFEDPDGHVMELITRPYGSGGATT